MIKTFEEFIRESYHTHSGDNVFIILLKNDDYFQEVWGVYEKSEYELAWKNAVKDFNNGGMDDLTHLYLIEIPRDVYAEKSELINNLMQGNESPEKEDPDMDLIEQLDVFEILDQIDGGAF
jgi:hypothetical protein